VLVATWEADDGRSAGAAAFDAASGAPRWAVPLEPDGVSGPAVVRVGDRALAVIVAGDLAAHALRTDTGEQAWVTDVDGAGSPEVPPVAVGGGSVLVAHRLGGLVLLDSTGRPRWRASSDGAAVRGGPVGPGPRGRFALPLDDGRVLLAGPRGDRDLVDPLGRVSGVARGARDALVVATREAEANRVSAYSGW
jgi:outer membrane protein assembly factor BamB